MLKYLVHSICVIIQTRTRCPLELHMNALAPAHASGPGGHLVAIINTSEANFLLELRFACSPLIASNLKRGIFSDTVSDRYYTCERQCELHCIVEGTLDADRQSLRYGGDGQYCERAADTVITVCLEFGNTPKCWMCCCCTA